MLKKTKKIVLIGGPGTGKSSIIHELTKRGYSCKPEISREVTLEAQKKGIDQLFLKEPILFSRLLLQGRVRQFKETDQSREQFVFFDRGVPDVIAYLNYTKTLFPQEFTNQTNACIYDCIFHCTPWKTIYTKDNERYESFEASKKIDHYLKQTYESLGYKIRTVPFNTISKRADFILNSLNCE